VFVCLKELLANFSHIAFPWICSCVHGRPPLQRRLGKGVPVPSELVGGLDVALGSLLRLLLGGKRVDLLAGLEEAAAVLLLELGANIIQRHQCRGSFEVVIELKITPSRSAGNRALRRPSR
jgi:hypothetical protein